MKKQMVIFNILFAFIISCCNSTRKDNLNTELLKDLGKPELTAYTNLDSALFCSKTNEKPVLLMFYANRNIADRNILTHKLSDSILSSIIGDNFVFVKLQVDAIDTAFINPDDSLDIITSGDINYKMQIEMFNQNEQPLLAVLNEKGSAVTEPVGFSCLNKKADFFRFLIDGWIAYKKEK